ncbi:hypothetical protein PF005_g28169 [Phytophthora fragariae]|uniref:Uncharacterized protein n=1 Tax=Phytophthora fragariae TaxID=53985 RepID=A0A6A3DGW4_9STRA|nr:hypothetical protein PF009_g28722 [Phytophthora fragariae]KAE8960256.1 hypothetical protein PF011_g30158 [Phytophthora fragariae]KAE9067276.1 hypothetical protein PF007_g28137 [Phytophthora fragariae]KAE9118312.1 hypothetical protein PF010_g8252 [Phytophthora fragariae]KAE9163433.1 hypothetical protein PF004_g30145 [Phytophthora fragariae]
MLKRLALLVNRPENASVQRTRQLIAGSLRAALISVGACGWEIVSETGHGSTIGRDLVLVLPQLALLLLMILNFFPRCQQQIYRWVVVATIALIPAVIVAVIHSGFRMGVGLCCCSHSFCPATSSAEVAACGLVLDDCYMAFIRKIAHFYGTASLLAPLTTIVFEVLSRGTSHRIGQSHCHHFLAKTRHQ